MDKIKSKLDGSIFNGLIQSSRNSGIMISSTSYIVVENESQWKELEDKEKEILDNEYIKTYNSPEPESFLILSVFVILLALMKHKRRRYSC